MRFYYNSKILLHCDLQRLSTRCFQPLGPDSQTMATQKVLPKVLAFDLDGCVWDPEMYELWGRGGAPFTPRSDGDLTDCGGNRIKLIGNVREIMHELKTNTKWANVKVAVASCCNEPDWGAECIRKFQIGDGLTLKDVFSGNLTEIYGSVKTVHLRAIAKKANCDVKDIIFFDNDYGNCRNVAEIGVTVVYTPNGVTKELFDEGLEKFPAPGQILGPKKKSWW